MMLQVSNERQCLLVAEDESEVIGMCSAQTLVSTAEGGIVAIVEDLVVKAPWRGKGIGQLLLKAIEKWGRKHVLRFQLLCDRENKIALSFYQKNGWKLTQLICLRKKGNTSSKQPMILPGGQLF